MSNKHLFYDKEIVRGQQQDHINKVLDKYKGEPATDELRAKVYDDLVQEKHLGHVTIPFKVIMHKDESGFRQDYIEVLLDTRV
jgi:hypothetical protein